jgi:hypothetical protein
VASPGRRWNRGQLPQQLGGSGANGQATWRYCGTLLQSICDSHTLWGIMNTTSVVTAANNDGGSRGPSAAHRHGRHQPREAGDEQLGPLVIGVDRRVSQRVRATAVSNRHTNFRHSGSSAAPAGFRRRPCSRGRRDVPTTSSFSTARCKHGERRPCVRRCRNFGDGRAFCCCMSLHRSAFTSRSPLVHDLHSKSARNKVLRQRGRWTRSRVAWFEFEEGAR